MGAWSAAPAVRVRCAREAWALEPSFSRPPLLAGTGDRLQAGYAMIVRYPPSEAALSGGAPRSESVKALAHPDGSTDESESKGCKWRSRSLTFDLDSARVDLHAASGEGYDLGDGASVVLSTALESKSEAKPAAASLEQGLGSGTPPERLASGPPSFPASAQLPVSGPGVEALATSPRAPPHEASVASLHDPRRGSGLWKPESRKEMLASVGSMLVDWKVRNSARFEPSREVFVRAPAPVSPGAPVDPASDDSGLAVPGRGCERHEPEVAAKRPGLDRDECPAAVVPAPPQDLDHVTVTPVQTTDVSKHAMIGPHAPHDLPGLFSVPGGMLDHAAAPEAQSSDGAFSALIMALRTLALSLLHLGTTLMPKERAPVSTALNPRPKPKASPRPCINGTPKAAPRESAPARPSAKPTAQCPPGCRVLEWPPRFVEGPSRGVPAPTSRASHPDLGGTGPGLDAPRTPPAPLAPPERPACSFGSSPPGTVLPDKVPIPPQIAAMILRGAKDFSSITQKDIDVLREFETAASVMQLPHTCGRFACVHGTWERTTWSAESVISHPAGMLVLRIPPRGVSPQDIPFAPTPASNRRGRGGTW